LDVKVLYLLGRDPDATLKEMMGEQEGQHELSVVDVREEGDFDRVVELIEKNDRVISW
jgi:hypothetical protein